MPVVKFDLILNSIRKFLRRGAINNISKMVNKMRTADVAKVIDHLGTTQEKRTIFELINNIQDQAEVLREVDEFELNELLSEMQTEYIVRVVSELPDDDLTDILGALDSQKRDEILGLMEVEESKEVQDLLMHSEDSAGGIMTTNFFSLHESITVEDSIKALQEAVDLEMVFYIYLTDSRGALTGVLSLRKLLIFPKETPLQKIMDRDLITVNTDTDQEEVASQVARYNLLAIPVLDESMVMVGIITVDDIIDVIKEETTEDILKMVGAEEDIILTASPFSAVRYRLPWICANLVGGILSGSILWSFRESLREVIAIASFIPVITAMGGNVGIQTSTIIIRGLATGKVELSDVKILLKKEIKVGLLMGIICGSIVGMVAQVWHSNSILGISVGISMLCAIFFAAATGIVMPLLCKKLKIDPAVAAGPFVTTVNDISGLLIYMTLSYSLFNTFVK